MLRKGLEKLLPNFLNKGKVYRYFSDHHEPVPTRLPKVHEVGIRIFVKNNRGQIQRIIAFEGQSLLQSITRSQVFSFEEQQNLCTGYDQSYPPHIRPHDVMSSGPNCAGCQVILHDNWFDRVQAETDGYNRKEEQLLHILNAYPRSNARLACCVPIEKWMDGLTCEVYVQPIPGEESILT